MALNKFYLKKDIPNAISKFTSQLRALFTTPRKSCVLCKQVFVVITLTLNYYLA